MSFHDISFRWFREDKDNLKLIIASQRIKVRPAGLLQIQHVQYADQGKYICVANNSLGEERVQISLLVTCKISVNLMMCVRI